VKKRIEHSSRVEHFKASTGTGNRIDSTGNRSKVNRRIDINTTSDQAPSRIPDQLLPSMETIDETGESTTTTNTEEEVNQLTQQLQDELIAEDKRHDNALAYYNQRVKEEKERHIKQHRVLEAQLLQAIAQQEGSTADSDYWLSNRKIPKKEPPKKPSKQEKALIRARVKKAYTASKKK